MPVVTQHLMNRPIWFDLSLFDLLATTTLYVELFGWTLDDLLVELGLYTVAFVKGVVAAAIAPRMPAQDAAPVTRTAYFGVTDANAIDKFRRTATAGTRSRRIAPTSRICNSLMKAW